MVRIIWQGMFGNGWQIGMMKIIMMFPLQKTLQDRQHAVSEWSEGVHGMKQISWFALQIADHFRPEVKQMTEAFAALKMNKTLPQASSLS